MRKTVKDEKYYVDDLIQYLKENKKYITQYTTEQDLDKRGTTQITITLLNKITK